MRVHRFVSPSSRRPAAGGVQDARRAGRGGGLRRAVALSLGAVAVFAASLVNVPVAQAVYANPDTSAGEYSDMIDWLDWDGASNVQNC